MAAPAAPHADGAEGVPPYGERGPGAIRHARCSAGEGSGAVRRTCPSLPAGPVAERRTPGTVCRGNTRESGSDGRRASLARQGVLSILSRAALMMGRGG